MHEPIFFTLLDVVSPRGIIRNNSIIKSTQLHVDNSRRIVWVSLKKKKNEMTFYSTKKTLDLNSLAPNNYIFLLFLNVHFLSDTDD